MSTKPENERRFLVRFPDTDNLDIVREISIKQTYLENGENNSQRRVRRTEEGSETKYIYTEKIFLTPIVRQETEYNITQDEYEKFIISEKRSDCVPVEKIRYCFEYRSQLFELDKYPFSDDLAIMEIELKNPEQEIFFPDNIDIIKEVTGIHDYSNAVIAKAGSFPEQSEKR